MSAARTGRTGRRSAGVAAAVVVGLLLRLGFGLAYWTGKPLTHDEREYLSLAANLAAGRGFTADLPHEPPHPLADRFGRAPLYPLVLAPFVAFDANLRAGHLPPEVPVPVKAAQSLAGALGIWLVASIARRSLGERAAVAAAWLAAVYPPLVWICAYALSEAFYSTLALGVAASLGTVIDGPGNGRRQTGDTARVLGAGLLVGLAVLARPATLFLLPLAAAWLAWRHRLALALVLLAGAAVTILPWTARNHLHYGRFVLVASEGGVTFWTGNHPLAIGEGDLAANPPLKLANQALRARHPDLSPEALEPVYYREALGWIAHQPAAWLWLTARKAFYTVVPIGPSYRLHSALYFWASVMSYGLLLPWAAAGARQVARRAAQPRALWLLAASAVLVCLVFFPQERFRIPVIDPALIVAASAPLSRFVPDRA